MMSAHRISGIILGLRAFRLTARYTTLPATMRRGRTTRVNSDPPSTLYTRRPSGVAVNLAVISLFVRIREFGSGQDDILYSGFVVKSVRTRVRKNITIALVADEV